MRYVCNTGTPRDLDRPSEFRSEDAMLEWIARQVGRPIEEVRAGRRAAAERRAGSDQDLEKLRARIAARLHVTPPPAPRPAPASDPAQARARRHLEDLTR